jgi:hypothetical protein
MVEKSYIVSDTEKFGANPATIQWNVVRGDTATLKVDFLEDDETTKYNISTWSFKATAYDPTGDILDEMLVTATTGSVTITAPASMTLNWGTAYKTIVAELPFDLQAQIPVAGEDTVWTPVVGTIRVLGDITPGGSL